MAIFTICANIFLTLASYLQIPQSTHEYTTSLCKSIINFETLCLIAKDEPCIKRVYALAQRPCAYLGCTRLKQSLKTPLKRGKLCAGCGIVRYCSIDCQKVDWKEHKVTCKLIQEDTASVESAKASEEFDTELENEAN